MSRCAWLHNGLAIMSTMSIITLCDIVHSWHAAWHEWNLCSFMILCVVTVRTYKASNRYIHLIMVEMLCWSISNAVIIWINDAFILRPALHTLFAIDRWAFDRACLMVCVLKICQCRLSCNYIIIQYPCIIYPNSHPIASIMDMNNTYVCHTGMVDSIIILYSRKSHVL